MEQAKWDTASLQWPQFVCLCEFLQQAWLPEYRDRDSKRSTLDQKSWPRLTGFLGVHLQGTAFVPKVRRKVLEVGAGTPEGAATATVDCARQTAGQGWLVPKPLPVCRKTVVSGI